MKAASSIALLDTDFISKTLCINDKGTSLLDVILSLSIDMNSVVMRRYSMNSGNTARISSAG